MVYFCLFYFVERTLYIFIHITVCVHFVLPRSFYSTYTCFSGYNRCANAVLGPMCFMLRWFIKFIKTYRHFYKVNYKHSTQCIWINYMSTWNCISLIRHNQINIKIINIIYHLKKSSKYNVTQANTCLMM